MNSKEDVDDPHLLHLFDGDDAMNVYCSNVLNLSAGAPGPDLLTKCTDLFSKATLHRMEHEKKDAFLFQYGITSGLWEFREELAKFLTSQYGDPVRRADLVLTCGATHGLQLAMMTFLDPRAIIFVEDVTYMIALDAFREYPLMKIVSVPITANGVDSVALENIVAREKDKWKFDSTKPFWAMFYTIPSHHNPTGCCMSTHCCEQVVKVSRKLELLVMCDDVYNLLYYGDEPRPPRRLFAYDDSTADRGHVVSVGTFSKILAPGVRVGWLELPCDLRDILRSSGVMRSGGGVNQYLSGVVTSLLQLGYIQTHLKLLVEIFKDRMDSICGIFEQHLPEGCSFQKPLGGYFVWIALPEGIDASHFAGWCKEEHRVSPLAGSRFSLNGTYANCLRISIAFHQRDVLVRAAETICRALHQYFVMRA